MVGAWIAKGGFDGYIGCNVLRRFHVVLDYGNKRAILEPNAHLDDADRSDGAGLRIRARGEDLRTYYVHRVAPDSTAAEAKVSVGDVLVSIDGVPSRGLTMEQVEAHLRSTTALTLVFDRDGRRRDVNLPKRPML